jgi:pimeloyl-ACP methyl ester carboxylesterase
MTPILLGTALLLGADPGIKTEPVELKTATGTLHGTIDLPPGEGPWPVVLIHPGSGPTDRDGNQPKMKNDSLKMLGHALAAKGIACLRIDKRGIAASARAMGKESDLRIETYAGDVAAWLWQLRTDRRFTKVGLIGHSEGVLIGLLAAQTQEVDAFVSLCGMGRKAGDIIRAQLKGKLPEDLAKRNEEILQALEAGKMVEDVPTALTPLYRKSVQPFVISMLKRDSAVELGKLECPVLVVTGTHDVQVPPSEGDTLAAGSKRARHVTIKNMSHVLKETDKTAVIAQHFSVYTDPKIPLHPQLAGELAGFLTATLGAKK